MKNRPFGKHGFDCSEIGFGAWAIGGGCWGEQADIDSIAALNRALDLGCNFIDTAAGYGNGRSEKLIAQVLRERAAAGKTDKVFVATKTPPSPGIWPPSPYCKAEERCAEAYLRENIAQRCAKLGTERLDLLQLHTWTRAWNRNPTPFKVLRELQREGKIAHVGLSNVSAEELAEALALGPVVSVQNQLHPLDLTALEDGVLRACEQAGVTFIAYSPVGGRHDREAVLAHPALVRAGAQLGVGPGTVALAWLLTLSPNLVAIPGASRIETLRASLAARDLALPAEITATLDRAFDAPRGRR